MDDKNVYSVVEIKGKQYKVQPGKYVLVDKLEGEKNQDFTEIKVLMHSTGSEVKIGQPYLEDIKVVAKILDQVKDEKVKIMRYKAKKKIRRVQGHRQRYTKLQIESIS